MKPLIVGEQPSKTGDPEKPVEGRIGQRLAECCGLTFDQYLERFDRVNLLRVRAEYSGRDAAWNAAKARERAAFIREVFAPQHKVIILLGKRAARAFDFGGDYFDEHVVDDVRYFVVPHPSGLNRWWNDPANERRMYDFMQWIVVESERYATV